MGIIIRQSFWGTAMAYVGVLIGYFNTLYLRPELLSMGEIGIFSLITANAMMISPFCTAGMPATWIRQFPGIRHDDELRNQYFTFQMLVVLALNAAVIIAMFLGKDLIVAYFSQGAPEYVQFLSITAVIIVVNSLFEMLFAYCRSMLQIVVPSFLRDIFLRLGAMLLVAGLAFGWWEFEFAASGLAVNYLLVFVLLFGYLMIGKKLKFSSSLHRITAADKRSAIKFGGYFMLLSLSFALMTNASYAQISAYIGDDATGIFATCFFIGVIVEMPRRNMLKVLSPVFSKAMGENDMSQVERMYKKGSTTMTIIGVLLLIGILTNVNDLFAFIPQGSAFATGYWVVVTVCAAKLILMLFSFSSEILVFSEKYRYSLYTQLIAAAVLIILNIILLPRIGLIGAGISYLAAMFVHSFSKFILVQRWFNMHPFTRDHWKLLIISIAVFLLFLYLPFPFDPILNIGIRSVLTTVIFVGLIFKMNVSQDINQLIQTTFEKITSK